MNKKVYQNINLTCVFQNAQSGSDKVVTGVLCSTSDSSVLFQETLPRKRDIRNSRLYEGTLVNVVRRKDGLYYPFLKAFNPKEIEDKSEFAFRIYSEINAALNAID